MSYKPEGYNDLCPYFVVNDPEKFVDFLEKVFNAEKLRRYEHGGILVHAEMKIGDSVLMFAKANQQFPPSSAIIHVYVSDASAVYQKAIDHGCQSMGEPTSREGDPDMRGGFRDDFGNMWSISTQLKNEKS